MVQKFLDVKVTDYIDEGVTKLLDRDISVLSKMSGPKFPEDPIEDMWFNNTTERKVYTYKDGEFKLLIDYTYPYLGSETIASRYQPLHENLTNFSNTKVLGKGFISHKAFVAMSDFFANALDLRTVSNFLKQLEIADIGYKNQITVNHVPENTITNDKFNPPLPVDPQFVTGDLLQTFKLGNKDSFIALEENRTLGALSSSASYRGSEYYPLYELLWQRNITDVYDISENVATRGESALSDFQNNISVGLPVKSEVLDFKVNENVISTTGTTAQNVTLNRGGYYRIAVVGGGGGGATATKHSRGATGGSGAGFVGIVKLDAGNYTMTAGAGAAASGGYNYNGYNGGASTFTVGTEKTVLISAGGGTGGVTDSRGGYAGTLTISDSLQIVSSEVRSNGNAGTGWYGGSGGAGGASVYSGYGKGGDGGYIQWGSGYAGNSGFVELRYLGVEIPSDSNNSNNLNIESYLNGISVYIKI